MAGTIPISMTQQLDVYGQPLAGGQLYIIQAGTVSTPQDAFQDTGLVIKQPYPMTLDAAGRVPQFFLDNTVNATVKIRLQDKYGVVQLSADEVLIIGPSSGGGGGSTIDPTTIAQTGDVKPRYDVGAFTGWVRGNSLTIGSATSGATERANADCQALFQHLWGVDATLAVSGGRGASAAADWSANKQLSLPDFRGYALGGLADMGNTATAILTTAFFGTSPTVLGAAGGLQSKSLALGNLPAHTHGGTTNNNSTSLAHNHGVTGGIYGGTGFYSNYGNFDGLTAPAGQGLITISNSTDLLHGHPFTTTTSPSQVATAFSIISPRKLITIYIKL